MLTPVLTDGAYVRVEPEIGFVLARDLQPRVSGYNEKEIPDAIGETRLVLELIGGRYAEPATASFPELLADDLSNQGLFIGPLLQCAPNEIPCEFPITVESPEGIMLKRDGRHPDGHPLKTFRWLIQFLSQRGEEMRAGQVFITGSFASVLEVSVSRSLRFHFDELGVLDVQFCAA